MQAKSPEMIACSCCVILFPPFSKTLLKK